MRRVTQKYFRELLREKLGRQWARAFRVFRNYGKNLGWDVTNVLLQAVDKGKVGEVLTILEEHYEDHLQYQHPDVRGLVAGDLGVNLTQRMFVDICEKVLELQPDDGSRAPADLATLTKADSPMRFQTQTSIYEIVRGVGGFVLRKLEASAPSKIQPGDGPFQGDKVVITQSRQLVLYDDGYVVMNTSPIAKILTRV
ncbi:MAG: hypothetical protein HYS89_01480 [Candidatus Colwellbacteria bacterium]|nr:hypothetical protein [Candidatus Colwellbacteria bacterium]